MIPIEKTPRKGIFVKYYRVQKAGKTQITAQLIDAYGSPIKLAKATYTFHPHEEETDAKIVARNRALQKFNQELGIAINKEDTTNDANHFTARWNTFTPDEHRTLVAQTHESDSSRDSIIKYFANNVLAILDKYGPGITPDQCKSLANELYRNMLAAKKFNAFYVSHDDVKSIPNFLRLTITKIFNDKQTKKLFLHKEKQKQLENLFCELENTILGENRMRSLLESYLEQADVEHTTTKITEEIKADLELVNQLAHLTLKQNRKYALDKLIFLVRQLSGNETATKCQTNVHIRNANSILNNWCKVSDQEIPVIVIPEYDVEQAMQIELCKELPWSVRTRYAAIAMQLSSNSWFSCGGIIMMTSGPRVAEVCAIQFGDILDFCDWGVCVINYTTDGNIRNVDGKNIYYHRPIFLPKFAMDSIHMRKEYLLANGLDPDNVKTAYVVSRHNDPMQPANPNAFAGEIKKILQIAGCDEEYWVTVQQAMLQQPDLDFFRRPEKYDVAYCLRRDATSCMCNIAKIHPLMVDAILGHRLPRYADRWDKWITREDNWCEIIQQMERIVYDPRHSKHPLFAPISLPLQDEDIGNELRVSYSSFSVTTRESVCIKITIRTNGNSGVIYTLPHDRQESSELTHMVHTSGPYSSLPAVHSRSDYEQTIQVALEDLFKKGYKL